MTPEEIMSEAREWSAEQDAAKRELQRPRLVGKLSAIMEAVGRIPKNGYNDFHKYHYVMESDVLETVRHHFAANHIMLIPRVDGFEHLKLTEGGGDKAPNLLTTLTMTFSLLDGETGERLDFPWVGAGTDKGDKGIYKALTGGAKYFLLKMFLIATGDDPEREDVKGTPAPSVQSKPTAAPKPASQEPPDLGPDLDLGPDTNPHFPGASVKVKDIKRAQSKPDAAKPWKAQFVTFSDGREAAAWDKDVQATLEEAHANDLWVFVSTEPNKKDPKKFNIIGAVLAKDVAG